MEIQLSLLGPSGTRGAMDLAAQPGGKRKGRGLGYDFSRSVENIKNKRFVFGPRDSESVTVDATLAMLFECLTVECR